MSVAVQALEIALETHGVVHVTGRPGSGKSATARQMVALAEDRGLRPVLVAAPSGAVDAGILALANVTRQLGGGLAMRGGWTNVRSHATQLLAAAQDKLVLIIDEPSSWTRTGDLFSRRAEEALETLIGPNARWPAVVCDQGGQGGAIPLPSVDRRDLMTGDWGLLSDAARKLSSSSIASELTTPLEQRVATAILAWDMEPRYADAHRLAGQLAEALSKRRHGARLWGLWQRLALARTPISDMSLDALGTSRLSPLAADTLHVSLLDGGHRLHDVLRTVSEDRPPVPQLSASQRVETHELLFEYHHAQFRDRLDIDDLGAAEHAEEALFHAGELEDEDRVSLINIDLVEQLNALGYRLGAIHHNHRAAAAVYERAALAAAGDAYAVHHLAFHRDAQGVEADSVERNYSLALKLEPTHPTWHARRVAFLIDTARPAAARRAWAQAESELADDRGNARLYGELHLPVAMSLLAAGELSLCAYVLDGVPHHAHDATYRQISQLLAGRLAGQDQGAFVPAPRSGRQWWTEGPERLPDRDTAGRDLVAWLAGRVEAVDESGVAFRVVQVDSSAGPSGTGLTRMTFDALSARMLDDIDPRRLVVGSFVEIGRYRAESTEPKTGIVVLAPAPLSLPIDILPADRWQS